MSFALQEAASDPAEVVARVAASRRDRLLRVHRRRLRFEDLEDCYSQATLELLLRSRRAPFADDDHAVHAHAWWYVAEVLAWASRYRAAYSDGGNRGVHVDG
jgi:hypothetical protein